MKTASGTILDCILWETVASKFMEYCKNRTEEGPLILIIRHARLQKPTDHYPLQISNAWTGTKLMINEDIPDINEFKKSLPTDNSYATQNTMIGYHILKLADIMKLPKMKFVLLLSKFHMSEFLTVDGHTTTDPILRYRIDVQVCDGDVNTKFVFWDNSCIDLLGVSAADLQKTMIEAGVTDHIEYPQLLD
ncbi:hypothetical protein P8452_14534 [Trifolium repens]|nr:hypothetical protein QL285_010418 [Trifolium repens]WJX25500.1 hypothetical protein P8452_14534 [Trifolium repens]